jgi:predicted unusual protein kinase regulating ubiquinone biosynthesis (AarF/ABC1/UbiB family)
MGGKIIASAVFLDFGIVDSITDKHREYPESYVIPVTHSQMNGVYYQGVDAESVRNR